MDRDRVMTEIVELVQTAVACRSRGEFRTEALRRIDRALGIDFGVWWKLHESSKGLSAVGCESLQDATNVGFDLDWVKRFIAGRSRYNPELELQAHACLRQRGVSLDHEVHAGKRDQLAFYREIVRPIGSKSGLMAVLGTRGRGRAILQLGRGGRHARRMDEDDAECVRFLRPALSLGEAVFDGAPAATVVCVDVSVREQQIISYVGLGLTNREIALACGISAHTVHKHLANLFRKLHVSGRAELVQVALTSSLV